MMGYALISSSRSTKPIFISPGHRVSFKSALSIVRSFCEFKIPKPIRSAHTKANMARRKQSEK
jgi:deoxyinosine 3'endonuclease (endonuclease V)